MSFDDLFAADEEADEPLDPPVEHERPAWVGPPEGELGVAVPLGLVLARTERSAIAVSHALAFSSGVTLDVVAHAGGLTAGQTSRVFHEQHAGRMGAEELPDGFLRFGVELPDGRRVSNLGSHRRWAMSGEGPARPVLFSQGGGGAQSAGTGVTLNHPYWLWPLPEQGRLRLYCEWPLASIDLSHVDVDTTPLLAAAANAVRLWARDGGPSSGGTVSRQHVMSATRAEAAPEPLAGDGEASVAVPLAQLRALEDALKGALRACRRASTGSRE